MKKKGLIYIILMVTAVVLFIASSVLMDLFINLRSILNIARFVFLGLFIIGIGLFLYSLFKKRSIINKTIDSDLSFEEKERILTDVINSTSIKVIIVSGSYGLVINYLQNGYNKEAYEILMNTKWGNLTHYTYYYLFLLELLNDNEKDAFEYQGLLLKTPGNTFYEQKVFSEKLINIIVKKEVEETIESAYPLVKQVIDKYLVTGFKTEVDIYED